MPNVIGLHNEHGEDPVAGRIIGAFFNASLWGMVIALAFNRWTWLEMRFNIGWIFYGVWLVLFAILLWKARKPLGLAFSAINTAACAVLSTFLCGGLAQVRMIPACLIREGLHQSQWSIEALNICMIAFVVVCLIAIGALEPAANKRLRLPR